MAKSKTSSAGEVIGVAVTDIPKGGTGLVQLDAKAAVLKELVEKVPATCATCPFYSGSKDHTANGLCRRYAPEPNTTVAVPTAWPIVKASDWCGEHPNRF